MIRAVTTMGPTGLFKEFPIRYIFIYLNWAAHGSLVSERPTFCRIVKAIILSGCASNNLALTICLSGGGNVCVKNMYAALSLCPSTKHHHRTWVSRSCVTLARFIISGVSLSPEIETPITFTLERSRSTLRRSEIIYHILTCNSRLMRTEHPRLTAKSSCAQTNQE